MSKTLAAFFLLCSAIYAKAQEPVFRNYNTADGLPSSETYSVMQDSRGYIFVGTDRGVARFDGYGFTVYTTQNGLPDNTVFYLNEDKYNRIWFQTFSARTGYLYKDSVYSYPHNSQISKFNSYGKYVKNIYFSDDKLWFNVGTSKQLYNTISINNDGRIDSLPLPADASEKHMYITHNGYCHSSGDLNAKKVKFISLHTREIVGEIITSQIVFHPNFCFIMGKDVLMCANGEVHLKHNNQYSKIISFKEEALCMTIDKGENLWIGYRKKGIVLYNKKNGFKTSVRMLDGYSVSSVIQDKEGGFWFSTLENGIYYLPPDFLYSFNEKYGFGFPKILKVRDIEGKPAVVTADARLLLSHDAGNGLQWQCKAPDLTVLDMQYINGLIFYGNYEEPSSRFIGNRKAVSVSGVRIIKGIDNVWSLSAVAECYDLKGKSITRFHFPQITRITSLLETKKKHLILGSLQGLFKSDNGTLQSLQHIHPALRGRISDIKRLDATRLLIATMGNGLLVFDETSYRVLNTFTTAHGLPSMMCHMAVCESDSVVWVATNKGLCKITHITSPQRRRFYTADIDDGIISNEINDICIIGNNLWLATAKGLTVFPKNKNLDPGVSIPTLIQNIAVNGTPWEGKTAAFDYHQNNISINFTGISYHYAGNLLYKYRLKGNNENWSYTTNRNIIYNTLPPGNYVFECLAIAPNQKEGQNIASFAFSILPPFWQKWWFIMLSAITVIIALYLFVYFKIRFVRAQDQLKADLNSFRDKALRDQINPHFIYNSLNSIQNFILKNDAMTSASFLSKFSRLMRLIFNNASSERVPLDSELESLKLYAELENLRFSNKFTLHIQKNIAEKGRITIPPLIIQPFVENAILHGLLTKNSPGNIWVTLTQQDKRLEISIADDGIGRKNAGEIKARKSKYSERDMHNKGRSNSGIMATLDRINQTWGKNPGKSDFKIVDLCDENNVPNGTVIKFYLPITYD